MKAVTIGGATVDSIAIIDDDRIERMSMSNAESSFLLLETGRKTEASEISQHCGGGAVNAAVAMARIGFDVATVVKLGKDQRAETILRRLEDEGVSTRWVVRDARLATGASVMIASHERDAAIFTFRGANTLLCSGDLKPDMFAADLVYISGLSNESADCFPDLVAQARRSGAMISTNPGIRQLTSRSAAFMDSLADIDLLSINRTEANALVPQLVSRVGEGGPGLDGAETTDAMQLARRGFAYGGHDMTLRRFMSAMVDAGVGTVLVTDGRHGAYAGTRDAVHFCPTLSVPVAGTAGAGDAFASTFSAWLRLTGEPGEALRAAAINAASVIGHVDTQTGLLSREVIEARLAEHARSLPVTTWAIG